MLLPGRVAHIASRAFAVVDARADPIGDGAEFARVLSILNLPISQRQIFEGGLELGQGQGFGLQLCQRAPL